MNSVSSGMKVKIYFLKVIAHISKMPTCSSWVESHAVLKYHCISVFLLLDFLLHVNIKIWNIPFEQHTFIPLSTDICTVPGPVQVTEIKW